jgi:hypothetical protein
MTKLTTSLLALAAVLALGGTAEAGVNGRQHRQADRIRQGVASGDLTCREAARLSRQQARIRAEEAWFRSNDGVLGPWERAKLNRDLNRTSRRIYRQKHDAQYR